MATTIPHQEPTPERCGGSVAFGDGGEYFQLNGSLHVKQLAIISPAIMGPAYFREAAEVINAASGSPPDRAKMMDVFRRHGMTLAAPPHVK